MFRSLQTAFLLAFALFATFLCPAQEKKESDPKADKPIPEAKTFKSNQSVTIGGRTYNLNTEVGTHLLRNIPSGRHVTPEELQIATRIISFGCTAQELGLNPEQVELWDDVPMVSQQPEQALIAIRDRVEQLVSELSVST